MRTDDNNNPIAITTDLARQAGLKIGVDYVAGSPFPAPSFLVTAKFLGDPIETSIRVIDAVGYYTRDGKQRWNYIAMPRFVWNSLASEIRRDVIGFHYQCEGGSAMRALFPNFGLK